MEIEPVDPLAAWDWPAEPVARLIADSGLINETWAVDVGDRPVAVLQQLNTRIFRPELHHDIEAITAHLAARGRLTPRLLRTRAGGLWHEDPYGGVWRCLSWVGDTTWSALPSPRHAESAGRLVGRFHAAVFDMRHTFKFERPGAHDTRAHIAKLQQVLVSHRNHALRRRVGPIADEILELWSFWEGPTDLPARLCHGDLKVSNVRFSGDDAVALIDLDTFQWGTLDAELGDALRSWCNPTTEDDPAPVFDLDLFEAAMRGFIDGTRGLPLSRSEWRGIVPGVERICVELASRFARDALEESYFGWSTAYARPGEHHLARARAMTDLALLVHECADEAEQRLERLRRELS
jgi:Ser/Thr protein kinase RdoA (MazF antagonist)